LDSPACADAILQRLRKLSSEVTPDQMQESSNVAFGQE